MRLASQPELFKSLGKAATTASFDGRSSMAVDLASQRSRQAVGSAATTNEKILNPSANKPDSGKLSNGEVGDDMTKNAWHNLDAAHCQIN